MRRSPFPIVITLSWLLASCGSSDPAFGSANWQIRCPNDPPAGCVNGEAHQRGPDDQRPVAGFVDDEGISLSCVVEESGGERSFRFRFVDRREGFDEGTLRGQATFSGDGGSVSDCEVEVSEGGNTYSADGPGECGSSSPNPPDQPCQIRELSVNPDDDPRPSIQAEILCRDIVVPSNPTMLRRDVTGTPGSDTAAVVKFDGCDGNVL